MSLRDHLQTIYEKHDQLTPRLVMEAARPKNHPLHGYVFDRPPDQAAEAWYLERAHQLIQRVKITYTERDGSEREIRAFASVRTEKGYVFEPSEKVAADPRLREIVLRDMEREWKQLFDKFGSWQEFVEMVAVDLKVAA